MNRLYNSIFILLFLFLFSLPEKLYGQSKSSVHATLENITKYHLVWSDEFNGHTIDTSIWNFEKGANGWGNHEKEFYQSDNASLLDGNLIITAKKESAGDNSYTSSRMTTKNKKAFKYGKIEAKIKLSVGQGFWPAFWMLGADVDKNPWPSCGEIDIMEHINADSIIYGTAHWDNNLHVQSSGHINSSPSAYHIYSIQWDADSIKWFVDDNEYHASGITTNSTEEFHQSFYILLNFAIGGDWPGNNINDALLPAKMYVDYIRVYQKY